MSSTDKGDKLTDAIKLARIGAGAMGYRSYAGSGGMWVGGNDGIADATFEDWGLARAVAEILNAVLDGRLISAEHLAELDAFVAVHQYAIDKNPPPLWPKDSVLAKAIARHEARRAFGERQAVGGARWRCAVMVRGERRRSPVTRLGNAAPTETVEEFLL